MGHLCRYLKTAAVLMLGLIVNSIFSAAQSAPAPVTLPDAPTPLVDQPAKPHRGHFLHLVPSYNIAELKDPYQPISAQGKFRLFADQTFDRITIVTAGFAAGFEQATDNLHGYGQGGEGYAKRFGASIANQTSGNFLSTFFLPTVFRQDPRYFRKAEGARSQRFWYAASRVVITRNDHGNNTFNFSEVLGDMGSAQLGQFYYARGDRDFVDRSIGALIALGEHIGFNMLKEFGPDLGRKFRKHKP